MSGTELFSRSSRQCGAHFVQHLFACGYLSFFGQIPGCAQCTTTGNDGNFNQGVGIFKKPTDGRMAGLVQGNGLLFGSRHHLGLLFQTSDDTVHCRQEILTADMRLVVARSNQCRLVTYIGYVRTTETRRLAGQEIHIKRIVCLDGTQMHLEDFLTLVQVGKVNIYLTVKTSCTQQCLVQHVSTVGCGQNDDTAIGAKAVHLGKQLVQSAFALVITTHCRTL